MNLRIYDGFETKAAAQQQAKQLKNDKQFPVQYVQVRKLGTGRIKWGVYVGGKNSSMW